MAEPWARELESLLDDIELPINVKAAKSMSALQLAGMSWSAKLKPRDVLVHPANRAGQMLNAFDVMSKGMAICEMGWCVDKLKWPVCVQLPSEGLQKKPIFDANVSLAAQSEGMLCKPYGSEAVASISASHTTAFLKALEAGCKLPSSSHSMEHLMQGGDDLQKMIQEGWLWTVISSKVPEEVPALLPMLQQAFNSHFSCFGNNVAFLNFVFSVYEMLCKIGSFQVSIQLQKLPVNLRLL